MPELANTKNTNWTEAGIRHVIELCQQAKEQADEDDLLPTDDAKNAVIELIKELAFTPAPRMAITVNGDIVLSWNNSGDSFKLVVNHLGKPVFWRNKSVVEKSAFLSYVAAVPA